MVVKGRFIPLLLGQNNDARYKEPYMGHFYNKFV